MTEVLAPPARAPITRRSAGPDEVLIVSLYFYPEPAGSAPPITDLAWWLAENGVPTRVVAARPHYPLGEVFEGYRHGERDTETVDGVAIRRFPVHVAGDGGMLSRLRAETGFALRTVLAGRRGRIASSDTVFSVCPSIFGVAAASTLKRRGGRHVAVVHDIQSGLGAALSMGLTGQLLRILRWIERTALDRCDAVVTLSEAMADQLRELGVRRPIVVLPPQVDVRDFAPETPPATTPFVLYSGNFGRKQGLDQVLDMAAELQRRGSPIRVVLRGDGNQRPALVERAQALGLDNVTFAPLVERDRIAAAYAEAPVHLIPQNPDGSEFAVPSKVFSIMAAARPFIFTAWPDGPLDRLGAETAAGVRVPPNDAVAFADAVESLLGDPQRCRAMGERGRAYVEGHVDREVVAGRFLELLRSEAAVAHPATD